MKSSYLLIIAFVLVSFNLIAQEHYKAKGVASFYADKFEGRQTANGEIYYHAKRTAAHKTLPFGSIVKVTNLENEKYVVVRINDRGPFVDKRIIDLSKSAAQELGFVEKGIAEVRVELIASTDDMPDSSPNDIQKSQKPNYYKVDATKAYPRGKGVQIASFKNNDNVLNLVDDLTQKYNEEIYIEVVAVKKQKLYRIIMGNSNSESFLTNLKERLAKDYPGCFIVEYK